MPTLTKKQQDRRKSYLENRDEQIKNSIEYHKKNRDTILEKQKLKIECECGSIVRKHEISKHRKRQKHIEYVNKHNQQADNKKTEKEQVKKLLVEALELLQKLST